MVDFVSTRSGLARSIGRLFQAGHGVEDRFAGLIEKAGIVETDEVDHGSTLFGSIAYYRPSNP